MDHSPMAKVTWDWGSSWCAIISDEVLSEGQDVFNNYGPKSNEERKFKLLKIDL